MKKESTDFTQLFEEYPDTIFKKCVYSDSRRSRPNFPIRPK